MKPARFDYATPQSASEVSTQLSNGNGNTKLVAGSQSLGPMLNLRLARPERLLDVSALRDLREVRETASGCEIGASITHAEIEDGDINDPTNGWLREAAANIAHRAVRNRGTLGGSLAHADPAADWVIVMTGLGATVLIDGPKGPREVAMKDFVTGPFETALCQDELIKAVRVPKFAASARWGYWKFVRQVGEFAKASATVLVEPDKESARIAIGALGRQPLVLGTETSKDLLESRIQTAEALSAALPNRTVADLSMHTAALNKAIALAQENNSSSDGGSTA
ncbi:MAG: carbon monoxide dehydrogenase [Hyphomicrobiaceae bacterium TMED74]|nr:carbon monoxide dehydrogenase [Filomicrobium sp.]RPG39110.1 MAG: carbon monoxide dehydrogenase [Hyphomicrobiaceae bacterium TMED74]